MHGTPDTPRTLEEALLVAGLHNASRAFEQFKSRIHLERLDAAVSVGLAVELILKYLLASEAPALIAEFRSGSHENTLRTRRLLSSAPVSFGPQVADIKSCTADEAFYMICKLFAESEVITPEGFQAVMRVRNAAVHLGALPTLVGFEDAIYALLELLTAVQERALLPARVDWAFGPDAKRFSELYRESRASVVQKKIKAAQARWKENKEALHAVSSIEAFFNKETFRQTYETQDPWFASLLDYRHAACPACDSGKAQFLCEKVGDAAGSGEALDPYRSITIYYPLSFGCGRCGLTLNSPELRALSHGEDRWATKWTEPITDDPQNPIDDKVGRSKRGKQ